MIGHRMIGALLALYPRAWRDRYGEEYRALLEDTGLRPAVVGNVLLHAGLVRTQQHRTALLRFGALIVFAMAEALALAAGYTENILWLPREPASLVLLAVAVVSLAVVVVPLAAGMGRMAIRAVRR
ncbi:hypothetical protein [Flexivirga sp. B27]